MSKDRASGVDTTLLLLAQSVALNLPRTSTRQSIAELDGAWILIRRDVLFDKVLQHPYQSGIPGMALPEHHKRLDDRTAFCIGCAYNSALRHCGMHEQNSFNLRPGDVIACRNDHVVCACLEPEVAILIHQIGITGEVPAMLYIGALALVCQVATPGWSLHGQPPYRIGWQLLTVLVKDACLIARYRLARSTGAYIGAGRGDADMQHLG